MFSCEYCEIFKNNYIKKQLRTIASVPMALDSYLFSEAFFTYFYLFSFLLIFIHTFFQKEFIYENASMQKLRDFSTTVDLARNV